MESLRNLLLSSTHKNVYGVAAQNLWNGFSDFHRLKLRHVSLTYGDLDLLLHNFGSVNLWKKIYIFSKIAYEFFSIKELIRKYRVLDEFEHKINITAKVGMMWFWAMDHILMFINLAFMGISFKYVVRVQYALWFLSIALNIWLYSYKYIRNQRSRGKLKLNEEVHSLYLTKQRGNVLSIIKNACEMPMALYGLLKKQYVSEEFAMFMCAVSTAISVNFVIYPSQTS